MSTGRLFSLKRFWAVVVKEFIQMRRDRLTFGMMIGIPLIQLILFGYAINSDPKHLPAAVIAADNGPLGRSVLHAIRNSSYFKFVRQLETESEGRAVLAHGEVQFVVNIPENFGRDLLRGDRPAILVEADATDPAATSNAIGSLNVILNTALQNDLKGPLAFLAGTSGPFDLRVHAMYNPDVITQYNIVPGLMGVVLTMTLVIITGLAITRERERGTMENLLSMPTTPLEVMLGKIVPYLLVGYIQVAFILAAAKVLFRVPMFGSLPLLCAVAMVFHRRKPRRGGHLLHPGRKSAPGHADVLLLLPAFHHAFRVHVPLPGHARLGPGHRGGPSPHPLPADRPRHPAQGERTGRRPAGTVANLAFHRRRPRRRPEALPPNDGLIGGGDVG